MSTTDPFVRITQAWLADGPTELPDRVLDLAFEAIHRHPRRRVRAPWRPTTMSLSFKLAAAAILIVATVAAGSMLLGRGPAPSVGSSPLPSASASPDATSASASPSAAIQPTVLPGTGARIEAGRYSTDLVRPTVTLDLPCCFEVVHHTADLLVVGETGLARYIVIANPVEIIDPSTGEPAPLPENLAAWLASHPMLDVTGPTEVTISGRQGSAVEGTPGGDAAFDVNGQLKFAQGRSSSGAAIFVGSDHRFRFTVLDGAEEPLLVGIVARADRYEEFLLTAEPIVDGIALAP